MGDPVGERAHRRIIPRTQQDARVHLGAVEDGPGFIGIHPGLGIKGAAAGFEEPDHAEAVWAGPDNPAHLEAFKATSQFLRHRHFALARLEPAPFDQGDFGPQLQSARGDTANERVGRSRSRSTRRVDDHHQLRRHHRLPCGVAVDFFEELQRPELIPGDQTAGFGL